MERKLYRNTNDRIFGGVCSGLGEHLNIDPVIMRVIFVIVFFTTGTSFLLYLILWIIIPKNNLYNNKVAITDCNYNKNNYLTTD